MRQIPRRPYGYLAPCRPIPVQLMMSAKGQLRTWVSYSMTSSARAISDGGTERPSAFAALRLITRSNLVGNCTGKAAGLAP